MNKELQESRQVVAVLTIEDIEAALWDEQIQQLYGLLGEIEEVRAEAGKCASRLLIYPGDKK